MWIDNLIGYFSPEAELKRNKARAQSIVLRNNLRAYEGASTGRRTDGWSASGSSPTAEIQRSLTLLRNRSRDLVRNNPYASRGVGLIPTNVVGGQGIQANIWAPTEERKKKIQQVWKKWANSTKIDFDGRTNLAGIQRLAMRTIVESGEVLIRLRRVTRSAAGNSVPIKLQVLEPDFLVDETTSISTEDSNFIKAGIEFDSNGQRVAYHLYRNHPGDISFRTQKIRVPADEIIHLYRVDRAGQIRGVPWLACVMVRLRDLDGYEDAQLVRQKIAACFAAFVHDIEGSDSLNVAKTQELMESVEPGMIELLPPGKDVKFGSPPGPGEEFSPYMMHVLRSIAIGLDVTYEALTGDLSNVNFSSGRMGFLEMQRSIDVWREILTTSFSVTLFEDWFLNALEIMGFNTDDIEASWVPPKREMIDPGKEIKAKKESIRSGMETLSDVIRQNGKDPTDHFYEIAEDNKLLDKYGLVLDCDARKITSAGQAQQPEGGGENASS